MTNDLAKDQICNMAENCQTPSQLGVTLACPPPRFHIVKANLLEDCYYPTTKVDVGY